MVAISALLVEVRAVKDNAHMISVSSERTAQGISCYMVDTRFAMVN